jgi:hypothetical protein
MHASAIVCAAHALLHADDESNRFGQGFAVTAVADDAGHGVIRCGETDADRDLQDRTGFRFARPTRYLG